MRTIVAGSRTLDNYDLVYRVLKELYITEIVCGCAKGADSLGEWYGIENKIKVKKFPANWGKYGKSAGYIRNEEMAANADRLVAFWDGKSRGTKHMIDIATKAGLEVHVIEYNGSN